MEILQYFKYVIGGIISLNYENTAEYVSGDKKLRGAVDEDVEEAYKVSIEEGWKRDFTVILDTTHVNKEGRSLTYDAS